jgi:hypothetical protein
MCNYLLKNAPKDRSSVNEVENAQTHPLIQLRCLTCTSFSRFFHQVSLEVLGHISSNKEKDNFIAWQFGSDRAVETHARMPLANTSFKDCNSLGIMMLEQALLLPELLSNLHILLLLAHVGIRVRGLHREVATVATKRKRIIPSPR